MGKWKNFEELEEELSLPELDFILKAKREEQHKQQHFLAAIQGIDLDKHTKDSVEDRLEEVKRRAAIKVLGEEELERQEFAALGFDFEAE